MKIRNSVVAIGAAVALSGAAIAAPSAAASTEWYEQSAAGSSQVITSMWDNPITAPIATMATLSIMTGQYLIYCPIAQALGIEPPYSDRCVF